MWRSLIQQLLYDYAVTSFERQILCTQGWREFLNPVTSFSELLRSLCNVTPLLWMNSILEL